jgi:hypothetical protein
MSPVTVTDWVHRGADEQTNTSCKDRHIRRFRMKNSTLARCFADIRAKSAGGRAPATQMELLPAEVTMCTTCACACTAV